MTLAIYCAGGLGKELIELARSLKQWESIVFVDDITDAETYRSATVYRFAEVAGIEDDVEFVIASGEPAVRRALYEKIKKSGYPMATVISPKAGIAPSSTIGEGCVLLDCGISEDVTVQENTYINTKVIIGHDVTVGRHSVISPNCFLGGKTRLEECVYMAPGAMAKESICIGKEAIVSLGAVLLRNVRPRAIMIGNPARRIGENETGRVFGMFN